MRQTQWINYALYQIGWFACVLGGASQRPWTGFLIAGFLIAIHLFLSVQRSLEGRLVILAIVVGVIVETLHVRAGVYRLTSGMVVDALPPPWLIAMWAQFATTLRFSLRTVIARPLPAALFGAVGGPLAFVAGERLGAVTLLPPLMNGLLHISISWAIALLVFFAVVRRVSLERDAPRYRGLLVSLT
ncbi:MAG: DUF2878 domain-containing protein [Vicinamibacterales bacterium]